MGNSFLIIDYVNKKKKRKSNQIFSLFLNNKFKNLKYFFFLYKNIKYLSDLTLRKSNFNLWCSKLFVKGRGFRFFLKKRHMLIDCGRSHCLYKKIPETVNYGFKKIGFEAELYFFCVSKFTLMDLLKDIRFYCPLFSYKLKGIILYFEIYRIKEGKSWGRR